MRRADRVCKRIGLRTSEEVTPFDPIGHRWVGGLCGRFYQNVLIVIFITMDGRKTPWVDYERRRARQRWRRSPRAGGGRRPRPRRQPPIRTATERGGASVAQCAFHVVNSRIAALALCHVLAPKPSATRLARSSRWSCASSLARQRDAHPSSFSCESPPRRFPDAVDDTYRSGLSRGSRNTGNLPIVLKYPARRGSEGLGLAHKPILSSR